MNWMFGSSARIKVDGDVGGVGVGGDGVVPQPAAVVLRMYPSYFARKPVGTVHVCEMRHLVPPPSPQANDVHCKSDKHCVAQLAASEMAENFSEYSPKHVFSCDGSLPGSSLKQLSGTGVPTKEVAIADDIAHQEGVSKKLSNFNRMAAIRF